MFEVIRACLAGGAEEDEANEDSEGYVGVPVAFSPTFAFVRVLAFAFTLVLAFSFDIFADVKSVASARSIFGGHVTVLIE